MLDPKSLKLFISVVEQGSIATAAMSEHIAPAAVSRRLRELETELGTQLLIRSNKGIGLTGPGQALANLARRVLHDLEDVSSQMREYAGSLRGNVRIVASLSVITQFLPAPLKTFLAQHPDVQITLEEKTSTAIPKAILENVADIGIFPLGIPAQGVEIIPYRKDELVVIVAEGHPLSQRRSVTMSDLLDFEFVGLPSGSWINFQGMKAASELGRTMKLRVQVSGFDALCFMVAAGIGIGFVPKRVATLFDETLRLKAVAFREPWAQREFGICVRSYLELLEPAKRLVDALLVSRKLGKTSKKSSNKRRSAK